MPTMRGRNPANESVPMKIRDRREQIKKVADKCLRSSYCTVVANVLVADQSKFANISWSAARLLLFHRPTKYRPFLCHKGTNE